MAPKALLSTILSVLVPIAAAQTVSTSVHNTGFNSSFTLTPAQIKAAQLDDVTVQNVQNIMNFDRTQMAFGGPEQDDFYSLPPLDNTTGPIKPGQILKVQDITDPSVYSIPPNTGLSRIMYTTTNFNGTVIPTSGFILWPYTPHQFSDNSLNTGKSPVVVWTHGTSGFFRPSSPSTHKALWYDNSGPFAIAEAGYTVFAPDFAGLGISTSWDGSHIPHQYHAQPATAHDTLYGLRAALKAFSEDLENRWIVIGHSQGGGTAWGVAEALAREASDFEDLSAGYKGTVAASPTTRVFSGPSFFMVPTVGQMLDSIFPDFKLSDWLTPVGVARLNLGREISASIGILSQLFSNPTETIRPDYKDSWYIDAFGNIGDAGHQDFKGPLLVLQGTDDDYVPYNTTSETVREMWNSYPDHDLEFLVASGVAHVPILTATRQFWLRWIEERFEGKPLAKKGGVRTDLKPFRSSKQYPKTINSFLLWAGVPEYIYEVPLFT